MPYVCLVRVDRRSPRVRGNHDDQGRRRNGEGSIPARTGEPSVIRSPTKPSPVYPRAYGGTSTISASASAEGGLSPRVRGNRPLSAARQNRRRSIPARTGEPPRFQPRQAPKAVYPRAYGGTSTISASASAEGGLSPRVRGNRSGGSSARSKKRSIPARTGEPRMPELGFRSTLRRVRRECRYRVAGFPTRPVPFDRPRRCTGAVRHAPPRVSVRPPECSSARSSGRFGRAFQSLN